MGSPIIHRRLVRTWSLRSSRVVDDFPSVESAEYAFRSAAEEAGYTRGRNNEWHKPGEPCLLQPPHLKAW